MDISYRNFGPVLLSSGSSLPWLSSLICYQLSFIAISSCDETLIHSDFTDISGKTWNVSIPLVLVRGSTGELVVRLDNSASQVIHKFEMSTLVIPGNGGLHHMIPSYHENGDFRLMALIYVAVISSTKVLHITKDLTLKHPPKSQCLLLQWSKKAPQYTHFQRNKLGKWLVATGGGTNSQCWKASPSTTTIAMKWWQMTPVLHCGWANNAFCTECMLDGKPCRAMSEEWASLLTLIGFQWTQDHQWEKCGCWLQQMFDELVIFKAKYGHCNVELKDKRKHFLIRFKLREEN